MSATYKADFNLWIEQTAQLLRSHRWHEVDIEHLIEEVEGLGKSERRAIASQLTRLLLHLLKWQYQPQPRSDSWLDYITDSRTQIKLAIEDSPSLKSYSTEQLEESYQRARRQAAKQTGILVSVFPEECPYSVEVESMGDIIPRTSQLDPCVQLSLHTALDVLSLRFCSCVCNRGNSHELLQDSFSSS